MVAVVEIFCQRCSERYRIIERPGQVPTVADVRAAVAALGWVRERDFSLGVDIDVCHCCARNCCRG